MQAAMIDSARAASGRWHVGLIAFSLLASLFAIGVRFCCTRNFPRRFSSVRLRSCLARVPCAYFICLLFPLVLLAQRGHPSQYDVEAVYLYQFGRFVQWPGQTTSTADSFPICVLGRDPFGATLESTISGEKIGQLPLREDHIADASDAKHCRILFIGDSEDEHLAAILDSLQKDPILTVSETRDFALRGGMIQFVVVDNRVRFEINLATTQRAGLEVSSQLLKVASTVHGARGLEANP
jgi:hypothetical protein